MPTGTDAQPLTFGTWTFRYRPAAQVPARLALLIHGWTGDEGSMWVFSLNFPATYAVLAPRAPFAALGNGYSWREMRPGTSGLPSLVDLQPAAELLLKFLDDWSVSVGLDSRQFDLVGFSQGAAMTYTLAVLHPERVRAFAALSGFLPKEAETRLAALAGKPVLLTHGRQDDMIPVEQARRARDLLEAAGAQVTYCETDGGHRVSKDCFGEIKRFFGTEGFGQRTL